MPIESLTSSEVDGDASYQDAADQPHDDSDCGSEHSHGIRAVRKQGKYQGPKKKHGPSKRGRRGKKSPGGDGPSWEGFHHEMRFPGREGPFQRGRHHEKKLPDTPVQPFLFQMVLDTPMSTLMTVLDTWVQAGNCLERSEVLLVLFHLRKQRLYSKALKVPFLFLSAGLYCIKLVFLVKCIQVYSYWLVQ